MGQSLTQLYAHVVFSTKHRAPLIDDNIELSFHKYIRDNSFNLGFPVLAIGGLSDHIHILCRLSRTIPISTYLSKLKSNSSVWIKHQGKPHANFYWQDGYGAFSVGNKDLKTVEKYIQNQKVHHATTAFKDEFRKMLIENELDFNEKYVWD